MSRLARTTVGKREPQEAMQQLDAIVLPVAHRYFLFVGVPIEPGSSNPQVAGSSPAGRTIYFNHLCVMPSDISGHCARNCAHQLA